MFNFSGPVPRRSPLIQRTSVRAIGRLGLRAPRNFGGGPGKRHARSFPTQTFCAQESVTPHSDLIAGDFPWTIAMLKQHLRSLSLAFLAVGAPVAQARREIRLTSICLLALTLSPAAGHSQVAVMNGAELVVKFANNFDLEGRTVRFHPLPSGAYEVRPAPLEFASDWGERLQLSRAASTNPASWRIALPFSFPFAGASWESIHINLNGSVSFSLNEAAAWPGRDPWSDGTMTSVGAAMAVRSLDEGVPELVAG